MLWLYRRPVAFIAQDIGICIISTECSRLVVPVGDCLCVTVLLLVLVLVLVLVVVPVVIVVVVMFCYVQWRF